MYRTISHFVFGLFFLALSSHITAQIPEPVPPYTESREKIMLDHHNIYSEAIAQGIESSVTITLPIRGHAYLFEAIPNDVLDLESKMEKPHILTYDLKGSDNSWTGSLTLTSVGLYATLMTQEGLTTIFPDNPQNPYFHIIEYGVQPDLPKVEMFCDHDHSQDDIFRKPSPFNRAGLRSEITMGTRRYSFSVAVVVTGEYYQANGNTDNAVRASVTQTINALSAIYNSMMSFRLTTRTSLIHLGYTDPFTDIFTPGQDRVAQARSAVNMHFSQNSYDIGHVFHTHQSGDGWATGGVASLRSVCNNFVFGNGPAKAGGWSGSFNNMGAGWISLAAHEIGHQFGATHTFNGNGDNCEPNISSNTSYEIGSGTTIMSYNGLCASGTNIPGSGDADNYFHIISMEQMHDYIINTVGNSCGGPRDSENAPPVVNANPCNVSIYNIPKNTPFYVDAEGTWSDEDAHTFCWEQIDEDGTGIPTIGKVGSDAASDARAPLFRSYPPTEESFRYFPRLSVLSTGNIDPFDVLPTVARTINLNVALRDNRNLTTSGGNVANDEIAITVQNNGPMVVTAPASSAVLQAGTQATFSWNTNGSNALCNTVRIRLSSDGGLTYPFVLAEDIPYGAQTASVMIPENFIASTEVRAMIECMDFECFKFFNISAGNFTINSDCTPKYTALCPVTPIEANAGDDALNLNNTKVVGENMLVVTRTVNSSSPSGRVGVTGEGNAGCSNENTRIVQVKIYVTEEGTYTFNKTGATGWVTIQADNYTSNTNPCGNRFVASTAERAPSGGLFSRNTISVDLDACTEYYLVFFSFSQFYPAAMNFNLVSGPGEIIVIDEVPDSDYTDYFMLVNDADDSIVYLGPDSDFRSVPFGNYRLYSILLPAGFDIELAVNENFSQFLEDNCHNISAQFRPVNIVSSCQITQISAGDQTACVAATNFYNQTLIIEYDMAPESGSLIVNGQTFPITGSPQTITLTDLDSDGQPVTVEAFFSDRPVCSIIAENLFVAPGNCCPVNLELGGDIEVCQGDDITLDAGPDGTAYIWILRESNAEVGTGRTLNPTLSGTYVVEVTHSSGCRKTDSVRVLIQPLPVISVADTQSFCEGESYQIIANVSGASSISWLRNGTLIPGQNMTTLTINVAGTYTLTAVSDANCSVTHDIIVTQVPRPVVNLGPSQDVCLGETVTLDAGNIGAAFVWFKDADTNPIPGADEATFDVTETGTYTVVVTNSSGCSGSASVVINFFDRPEIDDFPDIINGCEGTPVQLTANVQRYNNLQWFFNNNPILNSNALEIEVNDSGEYTIEASNLANCTTRKSVQVEFRPLPAIDLGGDKTACIGSSVTLRAGVPGETHEWTLNGTPISTTANQIDVTQPGTYAVTVTNSFGCSSSESVMVSFSQGPDVALNGDATICEDSIHVISINTNANNPIIRWLKDGVTIQGENAATLSVTEAGMYTVILRGGEPPCDVERSVNVTVNPKPEFNLGGDRTLCEGDAPPTLNAGLGQTSYVWTLNGLPLSTSQTVTADQTGTYEVVVTNRFGCSRTDDVTIQYQAKPTLNISDTYDFCEGDSLVVDSESDANFFVWLFNNETIEGATGRQLTIREGGTYFVSATVGTDCVNEKEFIVFKRPVPLVELGNDTSLCAGESLVLDAGINDNFLWSTGDTGRQITVSAGNPATTSVQTITVQVTSDFGCQSADQINVTLIQTVSATISADNPGICNGEPVTLTASGGDTYVWADPEGSSLSALNSATTVAMPSADIIYTVTVSDSRCPDVTDTESISISIFPEVQVSAGMDTCAISGRNLQLNASGGVSYQWDNISSINGRSDIASPVINITEPTIFTVTVTDANGCTYTASVDICVRNDDFKPTNVITPNGDGSNDVLLFNGLEQFPVNTLQVFNRWGNVIFEVSGYQSGNTPLFDGLRNGERLPADTYYYILSFDGQVVKSALTILWD